MPLRASDLSQGGVAIERIYVDISSYTGSQEGSAQSQVLRYSADQGDLLLISRVEKQHCQRTVSQLS